MVEGDPLSRRSRPDDRPTSLASRASSRQAQTMSEPAAPKRAERAKAGGKSELRRAVRRVTPGQGNLKESGTENIPPAFARSAGEGG